MEYFKLFQQAPDACEIPNIFPDPLANKPLALACEAARLLQQSIVSDSALSEILNQSGGGKMFGVLVVKSQSGSIGFLSSFSGMLDQKWYLPGFVPPLFDVDQMHDLLKSGEQRLIDLSEAIDHQENRFDRLEAEESFIVLDKKYEQKILDLRSQNRINREVRHQTRLVLKANKESTAILKRLSMESQSDKKILKRLVSEKTIKLEQAEQKIDQNFEEPTRHLKALRKQLSRKLQCQVFDAYQLVNANAQSVDLTSLFVDKLPPAGTGDCAAPKLFQFAFKHHFKPLALAEFWWGAVPVDTIRHPGYFYPPCRSKCQPLLPFMLDGMEVCDSTPSLTSLSEPQIIYEDEAIIVVDKPEGLLSVPGKSNMMSVWQWLNERYPDANGPLLVHRLDMATSGLLVAAKTAADHRNIQQQFISRQIGKRYLAILDGKITRVKQTIDLPLRVDLDDRPRQMVCYQQGKPALTNVEIISGTDNQTRVYFYPRTGRTHQLRVHAAHPKGLATPIVGDPLYGTAGARLMLHAEQLGLRHPRSGEVLTFESPVPF